MRFNLSMGSFRLFCVTAVLTAMFLGVPRPSDASPITYDFELLVTGFRGDDTLFSGAAVGDVLTGSVTFDPATAHVGETYSFSGGDTQFQIDLLPLFGSTAFYVDHTFDYALGVSRPDILFSMHFALGSWGATPLQFPSDPANLQYFNADILGATGRLGRMEGSLVSFSAVPEPTTLLLTLTGAGTLWLSRRSRRRASKTQGNN